MEKSVAPLLKVSFCTQPEQTPAWRGAILCLWGLDPFDGTYGRCVVFGGNRHTFKGFWGDPRGGGGISCVGYFAQNCTAVGLGDAPIPGFSDRFYSPAAYQYHKIQLGESW